MSAGDEVAERELGAIPLARSDRLASSLQYVLHTLKCLHRDDRLKVSLDRHSPFLYVQNPR